MRSVLRTYGVQLALIAVAAVWGGTFVMVKDAVARYPLYSFLALRFAIAVVAFIVVMPSSVHRLTVPTLRAGMLAGLFLTAGYVFQTWGLQDTTASKAAFITGMFVVITPVLQAIVLRRPPRALTIAGIALAVTGLWLISGGGDSTWTVGDTRVLICAVAYSAHLIVLGALSHEHDLRALTLVQLAVVAVVTSAVAIGTERAPLPDDLGVWAALLVTAVFASAFAFAVQTYAQRFLSPTKTALILITEPAFGGLFGWLAGDRLGVGGLAGSALILAGMVVSEVVGTSASGTGAEVEIEPTIEGPPVVRIE